MLPNFLHVGAGKAASTWLWSVCKEHPDVYVPESPDNVNFFTVHYHRGLDWYENAYFSEVGDHRAVGEFSNSYLCHRPALERIARQLPEVRLTMTLRHPAEALYLGWAHIHPKDKPYGFDPRKGIGVPLEKCLHHHGHGWFRLYFDPRFYARHLQNVLELFPREQVLVELYDDLREDEEAFLRRYFGFLGVDAGFESSLVGVEINPDAAETDATRDLSAEFRAEVVDVFADDIAELEDMLGRDLSPWREF
jgi:hypothetical protein